MYMYMYMYMYIRTCRQRSPKARQSDPPNSFSVPMSSSGPALPHFPKFDTVRARYNFLKSLAETDAGLPKRRDIRSAHSD